MYYCLQIISIFLPYAMEIDYKIILWTFTIIIGIYAYCDYIKDTLLWKTTPHIFSWLVFVIMDIIAFLIQYWDNAWPWSWWMLTTWIWALIVFILALRNWAKNITKSDIIALSLALIAIVFYVVWDKPFYSQITIFLILICAMYPTFRKSWNKPSEETLSIYTIAWIRSLLSIFASVNISFLTIGLPVFIILINSIFIAMVVIRRRQLAK